MKVGITGIINKPSTRTYSHNAGYTYYVIDRIRRYFGLKTEVDVVDPFNMGFYDAIVLTEGINFREGIYNLFGGVSERLVENLKLLESYRGKIYSFGDEKIDYTTLVNKRIKNLEFKMPKVSKITELDFHEKNYIIGDSHSLSVYEPGFRLFKIDGTTLYRFNRDGFRSYIGPGEVETLRVYAGNIDIRHHLVRKYGENVYSGIDELLEGLVNNIKSLNPKHVELISLLPIENESRKIPKTGYYEGKPYHGTWIERHLAKEYFNKKLEEIALENGFKNINPWLDFENLLGELDFKYMESRQSVHIAPRFYPFKNTFIDV